MAFDEFERVGATIRDVAAPDVVPANLDDTDLAILTALVEDARLSQRQLAVKLGISAPTVGERMSKLERNGVITHYAAQLNWAALGYPQVVHLTMTASRADVTDILVQLWEIPEIESVSVVTGDFDLLVKLRVRDYSHMRSILLDRVWQIQGPSKSTTILGVAEMPERNFARGILQQMIAKRPKDGEQ